MKYLKPFNKVNESLLDDILQGKLFDQIDDLDFDELRIDLGETYGKDQFNESDIRKIRGLVEKYLRQDLTPFEIESIGSPVQRAVGEMPNCLKVDIKTGDIDFGCNIKIFKFNDEYFVLSQLLPKTSYSRVTDSKSYISKKEAWFVIDGWDGFEEWADKASPYKKSTELFNLFTIPAPNYRSSVNITRSVAYKVMQEYLTIRDWQDSKNNVIYCFDDGVYFGKIVGNVYQITNTQLKFYGDGTLRPDGLRGV
jgi:hypothetical protein